eukprot:COSAG01_NODE_2852_length_6950_cov_12.447518_2_plen_156_part_00
MTGGLTTSGLYEERARRDNLEFLKPFFAFWKKLKRRKALIQDARVAKEQYMETRKREGALTDFLVGLKYVEQGKVISSASLNEFIRVHRSGLRDLDSTLYAKRGSNRADLIGYLNDLIIEGKNEVKGGWVVNVPRLPPTRGLENGPNVLAIEDRV